MRKLRLFLDTSVISHIDSPHKPSEEYATREFFKFIEQHANEYELVVSPVVVAEINACPNDAKKQTMISLLQKCDIVLLPASDDTDVLLLEYMKHGVLSKSSANDLTHIAYAVTHDCDCILSWNFKHFVNIKTIAAVNAVNVLNNYRDVKIVTPPMISGEAYDAKA